MAVSQPAILPHPDLGWLVCKAPHPMKVLHLAGTCCNRLTTLLHLMMQRRVREMEEREEWK